jgi:uncharacterized YigZ family protein
MERMPAYSYLTLAMPTTGQYKEKGSKFLAFAYPVKDEADVKEKVAALKKEYYDARHHCYAFILGPEKNHYRAADDGEPNHSAGDPILGQIRSRQLTNTLVVVVRYFGGIKLGVGGLVVAYKTAAENALREAVVVEKKVMQDFTIIYDYDTTPEVMKLVKEYALIIKHQAYEERCVLEASITLETYSSLVEAIAFQQVMGSTITLKEQITPL